MATDVGVTSRPQVVLWLVGVEVFDDHVLVTVWIMGNQAVHEVQELTASPTTIVAYARLYGWTTPPDRALAGRSAKRAPRQPTPRQRTR